MFEANGGKIVPKKIRLEKENTILCSRTLFFSLPCPSNHLTTPQIYLDTQLKGPTDCRLGFGLPVIILLLFVPFGWFPHWGNLAMFHSQYILIIEIDNAQSLTGLTLGEWYDKKNKKKPNDSWVHFNWAEKPYFISYSMPLTANHPCNRRLKANLRSCFQPRNIYLYIYRNKNWDAWYLFVWDSVH